MHTFLSRILIVLGAGALGLLITLIGSAIWGTLLVVNLKTSSAAPWSVVVMAVVLWLMAQYLSGKGWPRSTSKTRLRDLRANPITLQTFGWSMLAGSLAVVALAGCWIVLFQVVPMRPNLLPDYSLYPPLTVALTILMGSLVSPLTEEAGFRGYCQVRLEREFQPLVAVAISSFFFTLAHLNQGLYWPKLLVYYLAGITFGTIAYLANSILASIPVHIVGDLTFFIFVWPHDAAREVVWKGGADAWFWIHLAQAVGFSALSILAFRRLAVAGQTGRPSGVSLSFSKSTVDCH